MAIRAIYFDLDCTLIDRSAMIGAYSAMLARTRWLDPSGAADAIARIGEIIRAADRCGYAPRSQVCDALLNGIRWDATPTRDELLSHWADHFPDCVAPDASIHDMLRSLRARGLRLGVISNGNGATQRRKLAGAGLADAFDVVCISGELGMRKPDRAIFERALRATGIAAGDAVFAGDHPLYDVCGARDAGLLAAWVEGTHAWPADQARPELVLPHVTQLPTLLVERGLLPG